MWMGQVRARQAQRFGEGCKRGGRGLAGVRLKFVRAEGLFLVVGGVGMDGRVSVEGSGFG